MTGLPQGWARAPLGEIGRLYCGQSPSVPTVNHDGNGTPYVTGPEQWDGTRFRNPKWTTDPKRIVPAGCVFITVKGAGVGKTFPGVACAIGRDVYAFEPSAEMDYQFILRTIAFRATEIVEKARGDIPGLSKSHIEDYAANLPPLPEQRRIVRKLDNLSARSATARTHLTALGKLVPRYKLAVLRSAFAGDLTANFRAERALEAVSTLLKRVPPPQQGRGGRQPTTEVIAGRGGISVNVPDVDLPEGWDWVPLLRVARQETGHTPSRSRPDWWDGDVCWMSIPDANLHHGRVIYDTIQKTNEAGLANSSARLLPAGTVVLSRTASVGYICILGKDMATSQDFATWTCTEALLPEYLMYALLSEGEDIKKFGEGSTHTTIYFPEIRAFHIRLAPIEEQHEIVRRIKAAFGKINRLAAEAEKALQLVRHPDQRILAKAFAGDLVPQDPNDEPAETLLARIREARATAPKGKRRQAPVTG